MLATRVPSNTVRGYTYTCRFWTFAFAVVVLQITWDLPVQRCVLCGSTVGLERSRRCDAGVRVEAAEARVWRPTLPLLFPKLCPPNIARVGGGRSHFTGGSTWHLPWARNFREICRGRAMQRPRAAIALLQIQARDGLRVLASALYSWPKPWF